jgi:hypothetical protein
MLYSSLMDYKYTIMCRIDRRSVIGVRKSGQVDFNHAQSSAVCPAEPI